MVDDVFVEINELSVLEDKNAKLDRAYNKSKDSKIKIKAATNKFYTMGRYISMRLTSIWASGTNTLRKWVSFFLAAKLSPSLASEAFWRWRQPSVWQRRRAPTLCSRVILALSWTSCQQALAFGKSQTLSFLFSCGDLVVWLSSVLGYLCHLLRRFGCFQRVTYSFFFFEKK